MNLQIVLILIGIVLVLLVFLFSKYPPVVDYLRSATRKAQLTIKDYLVGFKTKRRNRQNDLLNNQAGNKEKHHSSTALKPEQMDMFNTDLQELQPIEEYYLDDARSVDELSIDIDDNFEIEPSTEPGIGFLKDEERAASPVHFTENFADKVDLAVDANDDEKIKQDEIPYSNADDEDDEDDEDGQSDRYVYAKIAGFQVVGQIDYWVKFHNGRDMGRENILAQYYEARAGQIGEINLYGVRVSDGQWVNVEHAMEDERFNDLLLTIQLVNAGKAIEEIQLVSFVQMVEKLAGKMDRQVSFMTSTDNALQQSQAIADFIRYFRPIIVVNVVADEAHGFNGVSLDRVATQLGLERTEYAFYARTKKMGSSKVNLYHMSNMDDTGEIDFSKIGQFSTNGVTFFTTPALHQSPGAVFTEMIDTAKSLASRLKGKVIIPGYEDASQDVIGSIRQDIDSRANEMKRAGLESGSDEAMRIF